MNDMFVHKGRKNMRTEFLTLRVARRLLALGMVVTAVAAAFSSLPRDRNGERVADAGERPGGLRAGRDRHVEW